MPRRTDTTDRGGARRPLALGAAAVLLFSGLSLAAVLAVEGAQPAGSGTQGEPAPAGPDPSGAAAGDCLDRGRRLLDANDADAVGASRDGLLEAERELRAALEAGCDRPGARRLLARTYGALVDGWADTAEERAPWEARRREVLGAAVAENGADAKARYEYALALPDRAERIRQLEASVRLDPADAAARRTLAEDLLETGREEEGARLLVHAVQLSDRATLEEHGQALMYLLRSHGFEAEEQLVRERMQELGI